MDDQQRARELKGLLAQEAVYLSLETCAEITAALRAAPEGFVMVPVEPTVDMQVAALGKNWPAMSPKSVWAAMLAARPQGVKDA